MISSDYWVYMGSSMTVWLLLYLCSYKLDGCITNSVPSSGVLARSGPMCPHLCGRQPGGWGVMAR